MRLRWPWSRSDWAWSARSCCVSPPSCWTPGFVERATRKRPRPCRARRCSPFSRRSALGPSPSSPGAAAVSLAQPRASGCISSSPRETRGSSGAQQKEMRKVLPKATFNCPLIHANNCFRKISGLQLAYKRWEKKVFRHLMCLWWPILCWESVLSVQVQFTSVQSPTFTHMLHAHCPVHLRTACFWKMTSLATHPKHNYKSLVVLFHLINNNQWKIVPFVCVALMQPNLSKHTKKIWQMSYDNKWDWVKF